MLAHIAGMCGAIFGACATMVLSTLTMSQPAARTRRAASASSTDESAPLKAASVSGKWRPMSPRPAAPSSASVMACSSASASEWPSSPWLCSMRTPPRISGRPATSACVSQPSPMRSRRLMRSCRSRVASSRSASARSCGQVTLKFSSSPGTSSGAWPSASTALASSVTASPALRQRALQQAQAEHLRRLRRPLVAARQRALHAAAFGLLQRVGQRQRQQAADGIGPAGVDQPVHPGRLQQAARRVVHQHPVVGRARRGAAVRPGRWPRWRRASHRRSARPSSARHRGAGQRGKLRVAGRQHHQRGLQPRHLPPARASVCATSARPASCAYCFGAPRPARSPTPAQGTRAKQRAEAGAELTRQW